MKHISILILIPTFTNIIVQMYTTEGLYAHSSNLEVMSLFLSGHFLVVLPHQFFCLLVKECVQLIFHQNMNETINSFVDFAIHEVRIVLELVVEAKKNNIRIPPCVTANVPFNMHVCVYVRMIEFPVAHCPFF